MEKMIVIGGNGKTGKRVSERLLERGYEVRQCSRSSTIRFDWQQPETWAAALAGMDKAYITFQPDLAVPGSVEKITTFMEEVKKTGIKKVVLLSGRGEKEAQESEQVIMRSGIDYTILQASWFMQNFSEGFFLDSIHSGEFVIPKLNTKEPFIDIDDLAEIAVKALTDDTTAHKVYDLTGPELLSFREAIHIISKATGTTISFREINMPEYITMLRNYQVPEEMIWLIRYLFTEVLDGRNESVTPDTERLLNREPGSFEKYVVKALQSGVWAVG